MSDKSAETIERLEDPWSENRPSIHSLVLAAVAERGSAQQALRLDLQPPGGGQFRWMAGALDSLVGKPDDSDHQTGARRIAAAIGSVLRQPSRQSAAHLHDLLRAKGTIAVVDAVIPRVMEEFGDRRSALAALSRRLIRESPDVEPVKMGAALLGVSGTPDDAALISVIGAYEEMTIYSVVALRHLLADADQAIWHLAKSVHGWGRIRAVQQLARTEDPGIKDWMLRGGFRNAVMYEYLAYVCATAGDLYAALAGDQSDPELLTAAAEILRALIAGGPAEDMGDYVDGAAACISFLRHMAAHPVHDVRAFDTVIDIRSLCEGEQAERLRGRTNWDARAFLQIRALAHTALQDPAAKSTIEAGLRSDDPVTFNIAASIASHFGIDSWPIRLERQRSGQSGQWYWLMQVGDPARIEQVLALAHQRLDLAAISSGPTDSLALGPGFADDRALNFVLQDLKRFPGLGWDLIRIGLRSRTLPGRNMAINALRDWGQDAWPSGTKEELRYAAEHEPDEKIRERIRDLVLGRLRA